MYACPGIVPVQSLSSAATVIKERQMARPGAKYALHIKGQTLIVDVLANGYLELNGRVPTIAHERSIDEEIRASGAVLDLTNECVSLPPVLSQAEALVA